MKEFEQIWDKVAKPDGTGKRVIRYESVDDLVFIYASGFVDGEKYTLEQWIKAFDAAKQKDKSYRVTYDQWMAKEKFYYTGPVRFPFDPLKIPEREYSKEELKDLFKTCIVPSSQATPEKIPLFLKDYEMRGLFKNGRLQMTPGLKNELNVFIARFPSPLRVLEVNVQKLFRGAAAQETADAASQLRSQYVEGSSKVKTTQAQLEAIMSGRLRGEESPKGDDKKEIPSVKDLQKQAVKKQTV